MPFLRRRRRLKVATNLIAVSGLAGIVASCGLVGGEGSDAGAGACSVPGVSPTQVNLGIVLDDTGIGAGAFSAFRSGVDSRLGLANQAGGVHGRGVVYDWADSQSDPSANLGAVRELVETKKVFGIIQGSIVAVGSADYAADQNLPVVGIGYDLSWNQHPNMFSWSYYQSEGSATSTWGDFIRDQGGTRAALVGLSLNEGTVAYHAQLRASLASAGVQVVVTPNVTATATNFDRLAQEMKDANVDTIAGAVTPDVLAQLMPAVRNAGLQLKAVLIGTGYDPVLLQQFGPHLEGTTIYVDFVPFELNQPAHQRMLSAVATYAPEVQPPTQQSAMYGWLSADLYLRGLQAAGQCPTRESFISGLRGVHDYDADGLLPDKVDFATNIGQLSTCYEFVQIAPGGRQFIPLNPSHRCGDRLS